MQYPKHLLQSAAWGEFRAKWGTRVVRIGKAQFTVHPIPFLPWRIGYMPRVFPEDIDWKLLVERAKEERCVFVKIEPNSSSFHPPLRYDIRKGKRMFAHATYMIDLSKNEKELFAAMHHKTRYNIRLAKRKGVVVKVGHSKEMLEEFLSLQRQTAMRQRFFIHPDKYYRILFSVLSNQNTVHIVTGYYEGAPLASMMVIAYNKTLFYPYGGTSVLHREKMGTYLVFWEAIRLGKRLSCHYFDLWNCLLPEQEKPSHPWYGFHRLKQGFGGELIRFCGAFDLVLIRWLYLILPAMDTIRWIILRLGRVLVKVNNR